MADNTDDEIVPLVPWDQQHLHPPQTPKPSSSGGDMIPQPPGGDPEIKPILDTSFKKVGSTATGPSSYWEDVGHKIGVGTRDVAEGLTGLPGQLLDLATWPGRAIQRAVGVPTAAPSTIIERTLDASGLPKPATPEEQRNAEAIRAATAMITPMGFATLAPKLAAAVPAVVRPFVASPAPPTLPGAAAQVVAGGTGGAAGDWLASREEVPEWLKPTARLVGNVAGAGTASTLYGLGGTLANAIRGIPSDIGAALDRLGITPKTAGAVSERPGIQGTEASVSRLPSGAGVLQPKQRETVDQFGDAVERTAAKLGPEDTAEAAGKTTQTALRDWRENVYPAEQDAAWAPLNRRMAGTAVDPSD